MEAGTVIRTGQLLGEFIDPSAYEMQVDIGKNIISAINIGAQAQVYAPDHKNQSFTGTVIRVNGKIDQETQTVKAFILLKEPSLKEGMYLEAIIPIQKIDHAFEVNRSLVVNQNQLFIVQDSILTLLPINILHKGEKNLVIIGLTDGMLFVDRPIPNAYQGMKVALQRTK